MSIYDEQGFFYCDNCGKKKHKEQDIGHGQGICEPCNKELLKEQEIDRQHINRWQG